MKNVLRLVAGISLFVATAASASMPAKPVWKNATFDQYKREVLALWDPVMGREVERSVETLTPLLKADAEDKGALLTWLDRTLRGIEVRAEEYGNDTDDYRALHVFYESMKTFFDAYSEAMKVLYPRLLLGIEKEDLFSKCFAGAIDVYKAIYGDEHPFAVRVQAAVPKMMGTINTLLEEDRTGASAPRFGFGAGSRSRTRAGESNSGSEFTGPGDVHLHVEIGELHGEHVHMQDPRVREAFATNVYTDAATHAPQASADGVRYRGVAPFPAITDVAADEVSMHHDGAVVRVEDGGKVKHIVITSLKELTWLTGSLVTAGGLLTASYCNSGIPFAQAIGSGLLLSPGGMLLTFGGGITIYATLSFARKIMGLCKKKIKVD